MSLISEDVDGSGVRGKGDGGFVGARGGRSEYNETRSGNIVLAKQFDSLREGGKLGGDPGFALGLFNQKAVLAEGLDPNRPKGGEIFRVNNEDDVVNIGENLNDFVGVSIGKGERGLVEKLVYCGTKVRAENGCGETFALKDALCDFKVGERGRRDRNV